MRDDEDEVIQIGPDRPKTFEPSPFDPEPEKPNGKAPRKRRGRRKGWKKPRELEDIKPRKAPLMISVDAAVRAFGGPDTAILSATIKNLEPLTPLQRNRIIHLLVELFQC